MNPAKGHAKTCQVKPEDASPRPKRKDAQPCRVGLILGPEEGQGGKVEGGIKGSQCPEARGSAVSQ